MKRKRNDMADLTLIDSKTSPTYPNFLFLQQTFSLYDSSNVPNSVSFSEWCNVICPTFLQCDSLPVRCALLHNTTECFTFKSLEENFKNYQESISDNTVTLTSGTTTNNSSSGLPLECMCSDHTTASFSCEVIWEHKAVSDVLFTTVLHGEHVCILCDSAPVIQIFSAYDKSSHKSILLDSVPVIANSLCEFFAVCGCRDGHLAVFNYSDNYENLPDRSVALPSQHTDKVTGLSVLQCSTSSCSSTSSVEQCRQVFTIISSSMDMSLISQNVVIMNGKFSAAHPLCRFEFFVRISDSVLVNNSGLCCLLFSDKFVQFYEIDCVHTNQGSLKYNHTVQRGFGTISSLFSSMDGFVFMSVAGFDGEGSSLMQHTMAIQPSVVCYCSITQTTVQVYNGVHQQLFILRPFCNSSLVLSGSEDGVCFIWDRATGSLLFSLKISEGGSCCNSVAIIARSADEARNCCSLASLLDCSIVSGSDDGFVKHFKLM